MPVPRSDGTASPGGIPEGEFRQHPAQALSSPSNWQSLALLCLHSIDSVCSCLQTPQASFEVWDKIPANLKSGLISEELPRTQFMESIKFHTVFCSSSDLGNLNHVLKCSSGPSAAQRKQELVNDPNKRRTWNCWSQSRGGNDTHSMEIQALTSKITQPA